MSICTYKTTELYDMGFNDMKIIKKLMLIDNETMDNLNEEVEGTFQQWYEAFKKCNDNQIVLE